MGNTLLLSIRLSEYDLELEKLLICEFSAPPASQRCPWGRQKNETVEIMASFENEFKINNIWYVKNKYTEKKFMPIWHYFTMLK